MTDSESTSTLSLSDLGIKKDRSSPPPLKRDVNQLAAEIVRTAPRELDDLWNIQHFERGKEIYSAGSPNDNLYLLLEGRARVSKTNGNEKRTVWLPKPGAAIGSDFFSVEETHPCSATAIQDSEVMTVSRKLISQLRESEANRHTKAFCQILVKATRNALDQVNDATENAVFMTVGQRLAQHLLELSHAFEGEPQVIHATHEWLAKNLGIWRETASKEIGKLKRKGLISTSGKENIEVINPKDLLVEMLDSTQSIKS